MLPGVMRRGHRVSTALCGALLSCGTPQGGESTPERGPTPKASERPDAPANQKTSEPSPEPRAAFEPKLADLDWSAEAPKQVLVVNTEGGSVSVVDIATMSTTKTVEVGAEPYAAVVSPDGSVVAVGVEGEGKIVFLSLPDFESVGEVKVGQMHHDHLVLTPDGKHILDANYHSDAVIGIDIETRKEAFRIEGASAPHVVKYGPFGKHIYVTCKKITGIAILDPTERELVKFHQTNVNPRSLTFSPDEKRIYFGSFWVDGFFEMEVGSGKVTRLLAVEPPADDHEPREVTYHGVEAVGERFVLAANEGRSLVDAVDVQSGNLIDRLTDVSKPCCIETIPGTSGDVVRVLVSNIGDGTLELVGVSPDGQLASMGEAKVGDAPKRVAFVPAAEG
jgi:YVTN family beta-propeller protein